MAACLLDRDLICFCRLRFEMYSQTRISGGVPEHNDFHDGIISVFNAGPHENLIVQNLMELCNVGIFQSFPRLK